MIPYFISVLSMDIVVDMELNGRKIIVKQLSKAD
jgi:hypothetical protein